MAGFCHLWIPNCGLIARPLYEVQKGPLDWTGECQIPPWWLRKVIDGPSSGPLKFKKAFWSFCPWETGICLVVFTQNLGITRKPVAYFSKQVDIVTRRWPLCLRSVAAMYDIFQEAEKFTLNWHSTVHTPTLCATPFRTEERILVYIRKTGQIPSHPPGEPKCRIKGCVNLKPHHSPPEWHRGTPT